MPARLIFGSADKSARIVFFAAGNLPTQGIHVGWNCVALTKLLRRFKCNKSLTVSAFELARPVGVLPPPRSCNLLGVVRSCYSRTCTPNLARSGDGLAEQTASENVQYVVVNFYHLVDIPRPHEMVRQHASFLEGRDVRGRIYISEQGVNAQYGGLRHDAVAYAEWLVNTQPLFHGLRYSVDIVDGHMFPKLRLKYKPNLISLAGGMAGLPVTDPSWRATPVEPSQWRDMLANGVEGRRPLILDIRNGYEWDAGHFTGAERPFEDEFNETPTEATPVEIPQLLADADPETPVMMYCTGGIRCDIYSTYLKKKGYSKLFTLEGGIQNYMKTEGLDHWNGSLFVFDGRMAIRPDRGQMAPLQAAASCAVCGDAAALPHVNCANIDCNKLFIACDACKTKLSGCCCESCVDAPRLLRPCKIRGHYGTWREYASEEDVASMTSGRGEGRISRRRKRQQALKDREMAKRALKVERRRHAKEAMARRDNAENGGTASIDAAGDRMAKLRELRDRLKSRVAV